MMTDMSVFAVGRLVADTFVALDKFAVAVEQSKLAVVVVECNIVVVVGNLVVADKQLAVERSAEADKCTLVAAEHMMVLAGKPVGIAFVGIDFYGFFVGNTL